MQMRWRKGVSKIKKRGSDIRNFISGISSAITIFGGFYNAIAYFFPAIRSVGWLNAFVQNEIVIRIFAASCFISVILLLFVARHYYKDGKDRLELFTYEYRIAAEKYRDLIYTLQMKKDDYTLDVKEILSLVSEYSLHMVNSLGGLITQITKSEVYGCIKLVDPYDESEGVTNFGDQTVSDFVRSSNTPEGRKSNDPYHCARINKNTDFFELMDVNNDRSQFYQPDLVEYAEQLREDDHEYLNSTLDWKDKYRSTAVVPICLGDPRLTNEHDMTYNVSGFLCYDAPEAYVFHKKHKDSITSLMKAYASLLYCVFDKYKQYLAEVQEKEYLARYTEKLLSSAREGEEDAESAAADGDSEA